MQTQTIIGLEELLKKDDSSMLEQFRRYFQQALDSRHFADCRVLLAALQMKPDYRIQQTWQHYQGVLLFTADRRFDEAERLWRELLTQELEPLQRARTSLALAIQLDELGQWRAAQTFYQAAIEGYQVTDNPLGLSRVYNNLGIMHTFQVEQGFADTQALTQSLVYHQGALTLLAQIDHSPATQEEMTKNWHGIGRAYALQQAYPEATEAFTQMFAFCQATENAYNRAVGLADWAALVLQPQSAFLAARNALEEAIALLTEEGDPLHLAESWTRLGNLFVEQQALGQAHHAYATAIQATESLRNRLTAATTQINYRTITDFIYTAPLTLHLQQQDGAAALTAAESARARVLADLLAGQNPLPHQPLPEELLQRRQQLRQTLEQAYALSQADDESIHQQIAEQEAALTALDRQLELLDGELVSLQRADALTATEICSYLPPDTILLTYVSDQAHRLYALVATHEQVHCYPLDESLTTQWLQSMVSGYLAGTRPGLLPDSEGRLRTTAFFPQLYKALLAPVWEKLQDAQTIYIIPTGFLTYLPLGALTPTLQQAPPLLGKGRRVIYAPSATVLFRYCLGRPPSLQQGLLAIAPTAEKLHFTQGAAAKLACSPKDGLLLGAAATGAAFVRQSHAYRIICFLGHALFNAQHPMLSNLNLSDGHLQAGEILRQLRIDADLVVLAACESGRSQVLRGDEMLGLSRALLYAGTRSLLVTLWQVHEIPTRLLVEHFFQTLDLRDATFRPFDPATALGNAQAWLRTLTYAEAKALLDQWQELTPAAAEVELRQLWQMTQGEAELQAESRLFEHPFFWSPYILIGEPQQRSARE